MTRAVLVRAPCRLHFGMFRFGHANAPQFGGVGVMVEPPAVEVTISQAPNFVVRGPHAERVEQFADAAARAWNLQRLPDCELAVRAPDDHVGLGVGTQLGLSIAAGLRQFLNLSALPAETLAVAVGRAARSAVGTHGFQHGGLIVDAGHQPGQSIGTLQQRVAVPDGWRFVLVRPAQQRGLDGADESDAFGRLPPVPDHVTHELWQITHDDMLPALAQSDCRRFGEAVYRFGRLAGECFAAVQGGPFASPEIARLVESIRNHGIPGIGQSSWGPTVFALCETEAEAQQLAAWLQKDARIPANEITIASPNNHGAVIQER